VAADGGFVLAIGNDEQFKRLCKVVGRQELGSDPRFSTNAARVEHHSALKPTLDGVFAGWKRDALVNALIQAGVPCGSVRTVAETLADPQIAARAMIATLPHETVGEIRVLGTPLKLSETPADVRTAPPTLGQHTFAILHNDLGMSDSEIRDLREAGAI
jgi:crotonobetainyl-CoA:carnitine CoA-transferase CaiB-like acyl-CoA transferase